MTAMAAKLWLVPKGKFEVILITFGKRCNAQGIYLERFGQICDYEVISVLHTSDSIAGAV
jgi:hypothetical protein